MILNQLMPDVWRVLRNRAHLQGRVRERTDDRRYLKVSGSADTAEILLYDEIGMCGINANDFVSQLADLDAQVIHLRINSPGGDVFDSVAMYNALRDHPARVDVTVDSLAASGASIIAMAGDHITMNRGSQLMIHDALTVTIGNAADLRESADLLDRISDAISEVYSARAGGTAGDWRNLMRAETWYSGTEAVDAGLANSAVGAPPPPAGEPAPVPYNLAASMFFFAGRAHAPAPRPVNRTTPPAPPAPAPDLVIDPAVFKAAMQEVLQ